MYFTLLLCITINIYTRCIKTRTLAGKTNRPQKGGWKNIKTRLNLHDLFIWTFYAEHLMNFLLIRLLYDVSFSTVYFIELLSIILWASTWGIVLLNIETVFISKHCKKRSENSVSRKSSRAFKIIPVFQRLRAKCLKLHYTWEKMMLYFYCFLCFVFVLTVFFYLFCVFCLVFLFFCARVMCLFAFTQETDNFMTYFKNKSWTFLLGWKRDCNGGRLKNT